LYTLSLLDALPILSPMYTGFPVRSSYTTYTPGEFGIILLKSSGRCPPTTLNSPSNCIVASDDIPMLKLFWIISFQDCPRLATAITLSAETAASVSLVSAARSVFSHWAWHYSYFDSQPPVCESYYQSPCRRSDLPEATTASWAEPAGHTCL